MSQYQTLLFYKYVAIEEPEVFAKQHLKFCKSAGLVGRILVGDEGINGSVSGTVEQCKVYMDTMHADGRFSDLWFKIEEVEEPTFVKMHVRYREEIVTLGDQAKHLDPNKKTGHYLEPEEFQAMMEREDVVVLDTRNVIEYQTGHFKGAKHLEIDHFRDFPEHLDKLEPYKDKKVLAYCTGGIRCEKATALLMEHGFKEVYQLHGGILNYGQKTGGKDFEGKMYVFDNRVLSPVNSVNPTVTAQCHICGTETERVVNCANPECNLHAPICENCGVVYEGACSTECKEHPKKRPYNEKGYYMKGMDNGDACGCVG